MPPPVASPASSRHTSVRASSERRRVQVKPASTRPPSTISNWRTCTATRHTGCEVWRPPCVTSSAPSRLAMPLPSASRSSFSKDEAQRCCSSTSTCTPPVGRRTTICGRASRSGTATGASSMYSGDVALGTRGAASVSAGGLASV
ncbi:hypothetical protein D9M69_582270 [compost metagenome]